MKDAGDVAPYRQSDTSAMLERLWLEKIRDNSTHTVLAACQTSPTPPSYACNRVIDDLCIHNFLSFEFGFSAQPKNKKTRSLKQ